MTWIRKHPWGVALSIGVMVLLVFAVLAVWILPPVLADEGEVENDVRSTLLQGLAGLVLAGGLVFTALTLRHSRESAARTYELEREGQITERFTRAIDQIGGDKPLEVRLGGIYALERIAKESESDHGPIMEVLTAYLREHASWSPLASDASDERMWPATDVQAVIAVLGRRELGRTEYALDLESVDLRRARFGKGADEGHFEAANLAGTQLQRADLVEAHLTGSMLAGANLTEAKILRANLTGANLWGANLARANLAGAKLANAKLAHAILTEVDLTGANLTGADLTGATLTEADLRGALLTGATLRDADLGNANLDGANLTGENLSGTNLAGASLREAVLTKASLSNATLAGADLREATLTQAFLTKANFAGAKLWDVDLVGASLRGANFSGAQYLMKSAKLTAAEYDDETIWPEGFDPEAAGATFFDWTEGL